MRVHQDALAYGRITQSEFDQAVTERKEVSRVSNLLHWERVRRSRNAQFARYAREYPGWAVGYWCQMTFLPEPGYVVLLDSGHIGCPTDTADL